MNRTGKDSLTQIIRTAGIAPNRFQCKILKVLYANRRLKVTARGYTGPGKVPVQAGIVLGTADNPKYSAGDVATVERNALDNRWYATAIIHKVKCAATSDPGTEVEVDTSSSFLVNDFAAQFVTPDSLFLPPLESLGDLWTPGQTPPGQDTYDVGGGYPGSFTTISQNIGLPNGATWSKYFVAMTGSASWTIVLNGSTIASGSGSASGALSSLQTFAANSKFQFNITSGSGSDLWYGVGV